MTRIRLGAVAALPLALSVLLSGCSTPATNASSPSSGPPSNGATTRGASAPASVAGEQERSSRRLAESFERGSMEPIIAAAGEELVAAGLTEPMLTAARAKITELAGGYEHLVGAFGEANPKGDLVHVISQHESKPVRLLFSFEPGTQKLNGFNVNLATDEELARARGAASKDSTGVTGQHATDHAVTVGEFKLPGTLAVPRQADTKKVAVVLLAGSGPQDRDETIGAAGNKPLRDLADALAAHGITTLRFDKRTKAAPSALDQTFTVADEYFEDTAAAVALLRGRPELAGYSIVLLGHSQGAMLLPTMLQQNPMVAGGISMAGSPRSLFDIIYDPYAAEVERAGVPQDTKAAMLAKQRAVMDKAKALTDPSQPAPPELAATMPAAYIVSLNKVRPLESARATTVPLLFLQGEADAQANIDTDFNAWRTGLAGRAETAFRSYPRLNHLFMPTTGKPVPADYDEPARVAPQVTDDIADWLAAAVK